MLLFAVFLVFVLTVESASPIVDDGQLECFDGLNKLTTCPASGADFFGQAAQYTFHEPSYCDNGDGTVTDRLTHLMWTKAMGDKVTFEEAFEQAAALTKGGYSDWRVPHIKELYSLIDFNGSTGTDAASSTPYIDDSVFDHKTGEVSEGERFIDAQVWSATEYLGKTMFGDPTVFGVNFVDGRIKGYPKVMPGPGGADKKMFVRFVRGNEDYTTHTFQDNNDGTVSDLDTGLMWTKADSGATTFGSQGNGMLNWQEALQWAEALTTAGYTDWRLPDAHELQSIVDYTRCPQTNGTASISPVFNTTAIQDPMGAENFGWYWTGTTHKDGVPVGAHAVYVTFGDAQGYMFNQADERQLVDVHGAGSQRSDPKQGDPGNFPFGRGPQNDTVRIFNLVRAVRGNSTVEPLTCAGEQASFALVGGLVAVLLNMLLAKWL